MISSSSRRQLSGFFATSQGASSFGKRCVNQSVTSRHCARRTDFPADIARLPRADGIGLFRRKRTGLWRGTVGHERFIELWLIGSEGLAGAPVVLGVHRRGVQVAGQALRIRSRDFRNAMEALPEFRKALHTYLNGALSQTSQAGACNSAHLLVFSRDAFLSPGLAWTRTRYR
jgi:hypothetical protein